MELIPPGTWCQKYTLSHVVRQFKTGSFLEVGCGSGIYSKLLCKLDWKGVGLDFSDTAIAASQKLLQAEINENRFELMQSDFFTAKIEQKFDLIVAMLVLEHVEDETAFLKKAHELLTPSGHLIVAVPGRKKKWCIEDDTAGHLRRYENHEIKTLLAANRFNSVEVFSTGVPVSNVLFKLSNRQVRKHELAKKQQLNQTNQTKQSGVRKIPFKTDFPAFFSVLLNKYTMLPFMLVQRLFYRSNLGLVQIAVGSKD